MKQRKRNEMEQCALYWEMIGENGEKIRYG